MYNPCIGTHVAPSNAFNNQLSYPTFQRESQFEGPSSNHVLLPVHNLPQGATYSPHPGYVQGKEYYTSQQFHGSGQESSQPRPRTQCLPMEDAEGRMQRDRPCREPMLPQHKEIMGFREKSREGEIRARVVRFLVQRRNQKLESQLVKPFMQLIAHILQQGEGPCLTNMTP